MHTLYKKILALTLVLGTLITMSMTLDVFAYTDGTLDTTFAIGSGADNVIHTSAQQSDGKIIIAGNFMSYDGTPRNRIARLNADGSLDLSFDPLGGADGMIYSTIVQSGGKIIIAGEFTDYNGTSVNRIARLNADGSLDSSFIGAGADGLIHTMMFQPDGKIIIAGDFTSYDGTPRNRIARLNADGSLDLSFDPLGGADTYIFSVDLQSDGKIIIGGFFTSYNGTSRNYIARINTGWTLDTSFDPGVGTNATVQDSLVQSDGKIIIAGDFTSYNGTSVNRIARLNTGGSLDASFNPGMGTDSQIFTLSSLPDDRILIGWFFSTYNGTARGKIARLTSTHIVTFQDFDAAFISSGFVVYGTGVIPPTSPTRTGYTFTSWTGGNLMNITGDTTFTAEYTINQYTITFDSGSGTAVASITGDYGTGIIAPVSPTLTGYTFSGWAPTVPATMPAMDMTVTGQWMPIDYQVSFDANGWSGTMSNQSYIYDTTQALIPIHLLVQDTVSSTGIPKQMEVVRRILMDR